MSAVQIRMARVCGWAVKAAFARLGASGMSAGAVGMTREAGSRRAICAAGMRAVSARRVPLAKVRGFKFAEFEVTEWSA